MSYYFDQDAFAKRLKEARDKKGLKNKGLADKTGLTEQTIANYTSGRRIPRGIKELVFIASVLDVSLNDLCGLYVKNDDELKINNMKEAYDVLTSFMACFTNIGTKIVHHPAEQINNPYSEIDDYTNAYDELIISIYDSKFIEFFSNIEKIISSKDTLFSPSLKAQAINNQYEQMEKTPIENDFELPF